MNKVLKFLQKYYKLILLIVIVLAICIVVAIVLNRKTATLSIRVAPYDAVVTINQQVYENNTTENFKPGDYVASVSKEGFETQVIEISLEDHQTTILNTYLVETGGSDDGLSYYRTNYGDLYFIREYSSLHPDDQKLSKFIEAYDQASTIVDVLPLNYYDRYSGDGYYVFYQTNLASCERIYCLEIGPSSDEYYDAAIQAIRDKGYNPDDYQIIYTRDNEIIRN